MFGISFLFPAFLMGVAAAAVPILLHLLKRETAPPLPFSAVRFLKRAPEERTRRQRLRELLLLALRVSAIVLIAGAFARPFLVGGAAGPTGVTIVAVDTSFSLSSPGRFTRARALARDAIDTAEPGHLVGVVAFSDAADLVVEPTLARAVAKAAVDRLEPGYGATGYRAALAGAAIGAHAGRVVVVTDLQRTGWRADTEGAVPDDVDVSVADVGGLPSNLALTALLRESGRAVAVVRNGGAGARRGRVWLVVNGRQVADAPFEVEPGASIDVALETALPSRGAARAWIEDASGYAADDSRYLVLDPPASVFVRVVTATGDLARDAFYVERAFGALEGESRFHLEGVASSGVGAIAGPPTPPAAVMLLSTRGLDRRAADALRAYVAAGGGLLVATGDDVDAHVLEGLLGDVVPRETGRPRRTPPVGFAPVDARHPIVRTFGPLTVNLGQVRFGRTATIDAGGWEAVARFSEGSAALVERRMGRGRVIVFASDLNGEWNDFPRHPTFVPFLHEALRHLTNDRRERSAYAVGEVPPGVPPRPGIVTIGNPSRRVAINVDPRESDPGRLTEQEFLDAIRRADRGTATPVPAAHRRTERDQGYWRYALALALATLLAEGLVGRRA